MDLGYEEVVALPVSSDSRQSVNVQLPTAILRNLQAYLEYVHAARAGVADGAYGGSRTRRRVVHARWCATGRGARRRVVLLVVIAARP